MTANPFDSPLADSPRRSRKTLWLVGGGLGCGVLVLVCCGGVILIPYLTGNYTSRITTVTAAEIEAYRIQIAGMRVPAPLKPQFGIQISYGRKPTQTGVVYASYDGVTSLVMAQFSQASPDGVRRQMDALLVNAAPPRDDLQIQQLNDVERTVNGRRARFTISRGIGENTRTEYWRVSGQFRGRGGDAALVFQVPTQGFTETRIREIVDSVY